MSNKNKIGRKFSGFSYALCLRLAAHPFDTALGRMYGNIMIHHGFILKILKRIRSNLGIVRKVLTRKSQHDP